MRKGMEIIQTCITVIHIPTAIFRAEIILMFQTSGKPFIL